jgi:hypothetical protein
MSELSEMERRILSELQEAGEENIAASSLLRVGDVMGAA